MIFICRIELSNCILFLNIRKFACLRVGPMHAATDILVSSDEEQFEFKREFTFRGCSLLAGPSFACSMQNSKQKIFRAAHSIFGKTGVKRDTHLLTLSLIDRFWVPVLLYGWEAIGNEKATSNSLDFVYNSIFIKLFKFKKSSNIHSCKFYTRCLPASNRLDLRLINFC